MRAMHRLRAAVGGELDQVLGGLPSAGGIEVAETGANLDDFVRLDGNLAAERVGHGFGKLPGD